jgi:hypothetical protein
MGFMRAMEQYHLTRLRVVTQNKGEVLRLRWTDADLAAD